MFSQNCSYLKISRWELQVRTQTSSAHLHQCHATLSQQRHYLALADVGCATPCTTLYGGDSSPTTSCPAAPQKRFLERLA